MDREKMCIAFLIRFIVNDWIQDTGSDVVIFHTYILHAMQNNQKIKIFLLILQRPLGEEISHLFEEAVLMQILKWKAQHYGSSAINYHR